MVSTLKQKLMHDGAAAVVLGEGILKLSCVQLQEIGFLLALLWHSETSCSGFQHNGNATYVAGGKTILRTAVEQIQCYGTRKLLLVWRKR